MRKRYLWLVRKTFQTLRHKRLRHRPWWRKMTIHLTDRSLWKPTRDGVATGFSIGMFLSVMPIPGQSLFAAILAMKCRGNIPFAVGACFLSNPFTMIPIWSAQLWIGSLFHITLPAPVSNIKATLPGLGEVNAGDFLLGAVLLGTLLAFAAFLLVRSVAMFFPKLLPHTARVPTPPISTPAPQISSPAPGNDRSSF